MVYLLLGTGFEETEAIAPLDLLRRAGIEVRTVGLTDWIVVGSHGIPVQADMMIQQLQLELKQNPDAADMVILPGGMGGVRSIRDCPAALQAVSEIWAKGHFVAAICAAPTVLAHLHITDGRKATCYPGCEESMGSAVMVPDQAVVRDGKLITGTSAGCAVKFGLALIAALKGEETAQAIEKQIVIR